MPIIAFPQFPQVWFAKPTLEVRERFERRIDRDFEGSANDNRSDLVSRWRVTSDVHGKSGFVGRLQVQVGHDVFWTRAANASDEMGALSLAYLEKRVGEATVTFGRQKLLIGDERLVSPNEWSMTSRSYDGLRVRTKRLDVFAVIVGLAPGLPEDATLGGVVAPHRHGETALLYKHTDGSDIWTLDARGRIIRGRMAFEAEAALQRGRSGGMELNAWAAHARAEAQVAPALRAFVEANVASGGGDPGETRTFDNVFPGNHNKYGIMDMQGWRNMRELAFGVDAQVGARLAAKAAWRSFRLFDSKDAWYGASGAANKRVGGVFRDPTGASGKEVGTEIDFEASYRFDAATTFAAGVAWFLPGDFIERMNGGDADRQVWGYFLVQRRF
jgi:hypothetical protein